MRQIGQCGVVFYGRSGGKWRQTGIISTMGGQYIVIKDQSGQTEEVTPDLWTFETIKGKFKKTKA